MNDKPIFVGPPHPQYVKRSDEVIVAWDDVPEYIQKKILNGTMTDEDWNSDWGKYMNKSPEREVEDVISELTTSPVAKSSHVHVFRKEYAYCLLKGCHVRNIQHIAPMVD